MKEETPIALIGDHRDIPLILGMIAITWNSCELRLRDVLKTLATAGNFRAHRAVEPLVIEMGTVGLAQALGCLADEIPRENEDISSAIRHAVEFFERSRLYRNYYIHGIRAVTQYGMFITDDDIERDTPLHETFYEGPFGHIWHKSAKSKSKFTSEFIDKDRLMIFSNSLVQFEEYLSSLHSSLCHYFRNAEGIDYKESAPVPQPLPLPNRLEKPVLSHPKLRLWPALARHDPPWLRDDGEEDQSEGRG